MQFHSVYKVSQVSHPLAATTAGKGDTITSSAVDMLGFSGACFIVTFGTITSTGTGTVKLQHSTDDGSTDAYADVAGSGYSYTAATDSAKQVVVEVWKPTKRYLKLLVVRNNDANAVVENGVCIQYAPDLNPPANSSVSGAKSLNTPVSGTA